ncbi:peptidase inhibitor family I36 protein [Streptomyces sp. NBC_00233]|uniref:peptidase inhibitor family I36 protein n=1 Tax=Streptomyces sp. NBC_00233 TaxID=2975686 RepID=UPI002254C157|nr:peptidase inhibitor family I36 protein [Streptomyces sp. NBC_00233]MCX5227945.1 peptidase inhibitor family I36 protein [Streptomyces sp. NBC_00233]
MNTIRTDIRRGSLITAVLALLCSAFLILPANAEPDPFEDCAQGAFCLYDGSGGTGTRLDVPEGGQDEQYTGTALSVQNNTRMWACVYTTGHYGGSLQTVKPGNDDEYVTDGTRWVVASYKLVPTRALCFTGYERCENGQVCAFAERNGRGAMTVHVPAVDPATQNLGNSYGAETAPKSVWNRTAKHLCFYPRPDYTGTWTEGTTTYGAYVVLRGDSITVPASLAGAFRSHELVNGTSECQ